ncbi:transglutaminase-like domain-containing protein [Ruminococcus albus]|uniref:Transglutaminase-like superfamily protein n=1 Tax=Ruminococcus albus TaxID=1264 RepID=A0A1I1JUU9_RUMAL|nr:transglutaminase-like domain-containing protein [Ruminococcus albus]SFC50258.1 Transglutaminase-like superfamily protein [Ruminococcus albus]
MDITVYSDKIGDYLNCSDAIDYSDQAVSELADTLFNKATDETDFVRIVFEYVRDNISHSADINADELTCSASEVLKAGHGICFAKSHLLAAILRCKGVPAGFCYQKLILDDDVASILIYHGLNGVYIKSLGRWIRLDPRGNKPGVNAQFSLETEQLAFPIRPEKGERDGLTVYPEPAPLIVSKFDKYSSREKLWDDLPDELGYITED